LIVFDFYVITCGDIETIMGLLCSRSRHHTEDTDENTQVDLRALVTLDVWEHYF